MKIVLNKNYGGYHLTHGIIFEYFKRNNWICYWKNKYNKEFNNKSETYNTNYYKLPYHLSDNVSIEKLNGMSVEEVYNVLEIYYFNIHSIKRNDKILVSIIEDIIKNMSYKDRFNFPLEVEDIDSIRIDIDMIENLIDDGVIDLTNYIKNFDGIETWIG